MTTLLIFMVLNARGDSAGTHSSCQSSAALAYRLLSVAACFRARLTLSLFALLALQNSSFYRRDRTIQWISANI